MGRAASSGAREHFARHREKPRADLEGAALGLRQRDVEAHLVIDENEIDHAAVRQGIFGFRYGENRLTFRDRENLRQPGALRLADEEHLYPGDGLAAAHATHDDCALQDRDRKSTRLNSSHGYISYAVFCLKKKNNKTRADTSAVVVRVTP